jgi:glycosyltransferase involved in cell wall biosynthesis
MLHDIIPLTLNEEPYKTEKDEYFTSYLNNNILKSNKIITNSDFTKNEFLKYCKKQNITNIPPIKSTLLPYQYRNTSRIFGKKIIKKAKITILLPGTIEPRKQQLLFMDIFNKFIKQNPFANVELIAFGHLNCPLQVINEKIAQSGGKIKYLGVINNETLRELYKTATFTCFISKYEGYGFPVAESLWHGTPVLTSCFGSMYEIAQGGGCYCVDTNNPTAIYDGLEIMVKMPYLLKKLQKDLDDTELLNWEKYGELILKEIIDKEYWIDDEN